MSTQKSEKDKIDQLIDLFEITDEEKVNLRADMISFNFLSEIERNIPENMARKDLAGLVGTSASYLTQLFRGNRRINFPTIAKIEKALNIKFTIQAESKSSRIDLSNDLKNILKKTHITPYSDSLMKSNSGSFNYAKIVANIEKTTDNKAA